MSRKPKVNEKAILAAAKKQLLGEGKSQFSMRQIAAECGIAVGTIYNYYPDKASLMVGIMINDWHQTLDQMNRCSHNAVSFAEGIAGMAKAIRDFCDIYQNTWENYTGGTTGVFSRERHRKLVDELVVYVRILLEKFATEKEQYISRILAETILTVVTRECVSVDELLALCSYITDKGER